MTVAIHFHTGRPLAAVASADADANDVALSFKVVDNAEDGPFANPNPLGNFPKAPIGISGNTHEHMAVIRQERPACGKVDPVFGGACHRWPLNSSGFVRGRRR